MCSAVSCSVCGKTTWTGCGQHVESVKQRVPASNWCGGQHTQAELAAARSNRGGAFSGFFGR